MTANNTRRLPAENVPRITLADNVAVIQLVEQIIILRAAVEALTATAVRREKVLEHFKQLTAEFMRAALHPETYRDLRTFRKVS